MIFLKIALATILLTFSSICQAEGCRELELAKQEQVLTTTPGWTPVRVMLELDWTALGTNRLAIPFDLTVYMSGEKARPDMNNWIRRIEACAEKVSYTLWGKTSAAFEGWASLYWLESEILLPTEEVERQVQVEAVFALPWTIAVYKGDWEGETLTLEYVSPIVFRSQDPTIFSIPYDEE